VVNPAWRRLDSQVRRERALLHRAQAAFGALSLSPAPAPDELEAWQRQKAQRCAGIAARQSQIETRKAERKQTARHRALKDLPKDQQFPRLRADRKHFVDTIKLIAYRAETALAYTRREALERPDDARPLVRELLATTADLIPDLEQKILTVRLHPLTSRVQDAAVRALARELTATETLFPGTPWRLVYELAGSG
jgi:hypothetical protein